MVHRRNKGRAKIGRDLEPKVRTEDGNELEEDPTREETGGAQWVEVQMGLAVVDMTTIRGLQTPAEEKAGGLETIIPTGAPTAIISIWRSDGGAIGRSSSKHTQTSTDGGQVHNGEPAHDQCGDGQEGHNLGS